MQKRSIHRTRKPIILARATHLIAFKNVLRELGAPIYGKHRSYALPDFELVQPDMYVPVRPAFSFLERMERDEGIDDLGFLASRQDGFKHLSKVQGHSKAKRMAGHQRVTRGPEETNWYVQADHA
jgi:hypothetical protein